MRCPTGPWPRLGLTTPWKLVLEARETVSLETRPKSFTLVAVRIGLRLNFSIGCGKENALDRDSVIRCINCGHRIFYKKREKKTIQYLAR